MIDAGLESFKKDYVPSLCSRCGTLLDVKDAYYYDYVCEVCNTQFNYGQCLSKKVIPKDDIIFTLDKRTSEKLTPKQNEIVYALAHGMTNQQLADHLNISKKTVEVHLHTIYGILGVKNRVKLAVAYVSGLL